MENDDRFKSSAISTQQEHGLDIKCISLDSSLVPSKFDDSKLSPSQAKQLIDKYAFRTKFHIDELRKQNSAKVKKPPVLPVSKQVVNAVGSEEAIYSIGDCGLFAAVLTAYNNHWKLRTSPDDWWFCVIKRVASAIDRNAKKESVRKMFVDHEGKKTIEVVVPDTSIYTVDYSWFFDQISKGVQENIRVPEFVDGMTADFSTTTAVQKIVSQITMMTSVQEYFSFGMKCGCGIPAVEMLGTEDDWSKLKSKLKVLRTLLEPIENDLDLPSEWWDVVEKVFSNLLATYKGSAVSEWWSHIMSYENVYASGMYFVPGEYHYRGWITEFLEGKKRAMDIDEMTSGLVSVPIDLKNPSGVKDTAAVVAGMLGFTLYTDDNKKVSVQPFQGWSLLLASDSPFREYGES
ncbi:uncharacterized protein LOC110045599 [Orbicella faveolata]|uniref:uncharacterized protein LOC110045599 n=1 Tax=Orbicella faveolata TaxID=48498 RepID=UPI0009E56190|nr:uncharacterized protein LOC110045599 [Orbicella faveolata]